LVRLAARVLCLRCKNVLVSDMEWPAYMAALGDECRRAGCTVTTAALRQEVFRDRIGKEELVDQLATCYRQAECDGLFLSAVTYQGVRLPIRELLEAIGPSRRPRLVVVDGAQALNHVPLGLTAEYCDLLLTGCHKWLRAYQPLGLAICCRAASEDYIVNTCSEMSARKELDDPLLSFTGQLERDRLEPFSETVNLAPLFTAAAAVRGMIRSPRTKQAEFASQLDNSDKVAERSSDSGWHPVRQSMPLRTGMLLLEAGDRETRAARPERLRQRFFSRGVALTAYDGGIIRASLPDHRMSAAEVGQFQAALGHCA
jgi:hypothetical protein